MAHGVCLAVRKVPARSLRYRPRMTARRTAVHLHMFIVALLLPTAVLGCGGSESLATSPTAPAVVAPTPASAFTLVSPAAADGGTMPIDYTCDGRGVSFPLAWSNAPSGTREFAVLMTTLPGDGTTKWNWVLYGIPSTVTGLAENSRGIGTAGVGSDGPLAGYQSPCSQGPGLKLYTFTVYALSASPSVAGQVTGAVLANAIKPLTIASASLTVGYTRPR